MIGVVLLLLFFNAFSYAQGSLCPPNIDFRLGNFTNWECRSGQVAVLNGVNTTTWTSTGPDPGRHQLIAPTNRELDDLGGFPKHRPGSSSYSVRLGSETAGHEADGLFYTFTISPSATRFSLLYHYAIVLQNPNHNVAEQPRFRAKIIDVQTDEEVDCVSFDFTASGTLPGFVPTTIGNAVYKDWTTVSVDLSAYIGRALRLEFITTDCTYQEHFGYAYVSVSSICNGSITGSLYCEGDPETNLVAPHGFQQYQWFTNSSFSQVLSTQQSVLINRNRVPVGSVLPVVITPFPGYGCVDTLYAIIGEAIRPASAAGPDKLSCSKQPSRLGLASNDDYSYSWSPAQLVSDPIIANPFTAYGLREATEFVVKVTSSSTGCVSFDTAVITPFLVDTAASVNGRLIYCTNEPITAQLLVDNPASTAQWFLNNEMIDGANTVDYRPSKIGSYRAEIRQNGCIDTSRQFVIRHAAVPKANFIVEKEIQCLNEPVVFTNRTTIEGSEPISYLWRFSDGDTLQREDALKAFRTNGIHTATIIATSGTDCVDSIQKQVMIIDDCNLVLPTAFTPNRDGKNDELRPFLPGAKGLKRFSIYNRWGNVVFNTSNEAEGWDGTYKGEPLPTGVYVWVLEYISKENKIVSKKGTVTLIR